MEIFKKNDDVAVVKSHVNGKYLIHTYVVDADGYAVKLGRIGQSFIYPIKDYGRAVKFFESRYL